MPELSQVTKFYVEGFTAEGVPYGPVHVLTTPLEEGWEEAEQALEEESARQGAWREAVMRSDNLNNKEDK